MTESEAKEVDERQRAVSMAFWCIYDEVYLIDRLLWTALRQLETPNLRVALEKTRRALVSATREYKDALHGPETERRYTRHEFEESDYLEFLWQRDMDRAEFRRR